MGNELTVAIIVSSTSLVVALISLLTSLMNNRHTASSLRQVEVLKNDLLKETSKEKYKNEMSDETIKSLQESIQAIQRIKDEIQIIVQARESSLKSDSAIKYIQSAHRTIIKSYENNLTNLSESDASIFHSAKNRAVVVETLVVNGLNKKPYASLLSDEDKKELINHRSLFTEIQQTLRDSLTSALVERLNKGG